MADSAAQHCAVLRRNINGVAVNRRKPRDYALSFGSLVIEIIFGKAEPGKFDKTVGIGKFRNIFSRFRTRRQNF